jgi:hypothetical protein
MARYHELLNPFSRPGIALKLVSHKLLRWLSPVQLVAVASATVAVAAFTGSPVALGFLGLQGACYVLGTVGVVAERRGWQLTNPLLSIPSYFLLENYGLAVGLWNFVRGRNIVVWETESRGTDPDSDLDSE